jgi:hypothetical protein
LISDTASYRAWARRFRSRWRRASSRVRDETCSKLGQAVEVLPRRFELPLPGAEVGLRVVELVAPLLQIDLDVAELLTIAIEVALELGELSLLGAQVVFDLGAVLVALLTDLEQRIAPRLVGVAARGAHHVFGAPACRFEAPPSHSVVQPPAEDQAGYDRDGGEQDRDEILLKEVHGGSASQPMAGSNTRAFEGRPASGAAGGMSPGFGGGLGRLRIATDRRTVGGREAALVLRGPGGFRARSRARTGTPPGVDPCSHGILDKDSFRRGSAAPPSVLPPGAM